jgi:endonuclease/exonuclease/phosphatase family metal-dependent hydrolase
MNKIKIAFSNLFQLFVFAGKTPEDQVFSKFAPTKVVDQFSNLDLDALCTAEMLFDDNNGNSQYVEMFKEILRFNYSKSYINEKSWVFEGKYYGMTIFSKHPIQEYKVVDLPCPYLEVTRPNGDQWILHKKSAQKVTIDLNGQLVDLFNLHYYPFHHFNKRIDDEEFKNVREGLVKVLTVNNYRPKIITGDFNNKGIVFEKAFPEVLSSGLKQALISDTTLYGGKDQIDHILYSSNNIKLLNSSRLESLSDHYTLSVEFEITA